MNPNLIEKGKTALISGAGSGLGFEFAKQLAEIGLHLILISKDSDKLNKIKNDFDNYENQIIIYPCDLSDSGEIRNLMEWLETNNFNIDILINNAGKGLFKDFSSNDYSEIQKLITLNVTAPTILLNYALRRMRENNAGIILNIASTMAFRPSPQWSVYAASKSFLFSLSSSINTENKNILISVLCPGKINTNFDNNAGYSSGKKGCSPFSIVSYTLKRLQKGKSTIIPGLKAKIIYYGFRLLPNFLTNRLLKYLT